MKPKFLWKEVILFGVVEGGKDTCLPVDLELTVSLSSFCFPNISLSCLLLPLWPLLSFLHWHHLFLLQKILSLPFSFSTSTYPSICNLDATFSGKAFVLLPLDLASPFCYILPQHPVFSLIILSPLTIAGKQFV